MEENKKTKKTEENDDDIMEQIFLMNSSNNINECVHIPSITEEPDYYYNFVMDDEDPVDMAEKIGEAEFYIKPLNYKKEKSDDQDHEKRIEYLEDSFHTNLVNIISTQDIFNEAPEHEKTEEDIYESLNNYILGRGKALRGTMEDLGENRRLHKELYNSGNLTNNGNLYQNDIEFCPIRVESAHGGDVKNLFTMDTFYNPKLTDDFVCGSFINAIKTPLTQMYKIKKENIEDINSDTTKSINIVTPNAIDIQDPANRKFLQYVASLPPAVGFQLANVKNNAVKNCSTKHIPFIKFIHNAATTINYNVLELEHFIDFPINTLNKTQIYSIRLKNIINSIDLELNDIKVNYIELDHCYNLKNLQIKQPHDFHIKGITLNNTPLVFALPQTIECLFSANLTSLFINFSKNDAGTVSRNDVKNIIEYMSKEKVNWCYHDNKRPKSALCEECLKENYYPERTNICVDFIAKCTNLKMLCLLGCKLVSNKLSCTNTQTAPESTTFVLPPNLREFWAIECQFSSKFVLPSTLFNLRIINCVFPADSLAESLSYLPDTLYNLHIEQNFCVVEFLKQKQLPPCLQKIYCKCCDIQVQVFGTTKSTPSIKNLQYSSTYNMKIPARYNKHTRQIMSDFVSLNRYCENTQLYSAKYPGLKYYLDLFYRDPAKKLYETMHNSDLYCCVSNNLIHSDFGFKHTYIPTEYIHHDLRIMDICKRILRNRLLLIWGLSHVTAETYDGKLPLDLIKYITFTAYPLLGIDKYAKFHEYKDLVFCESRSNDLTLIYEEVKRKKIDETEFDDNYQNDMDDENTDYYDYICRNLDKDDYYS